MSEERSILLDILVLTAQLGSKNCVSSTSGIHVISNTI